MCFDFSFYPVSHGSSPVDHHHHHDQNLLNHDHRHRHRHCQHHDHFRMIIITISVIMTVIGAVMVVVVVVAPIDTFFLSPLSNPIQLVHISLQKEELHTTNMRILISTGDPIHLTAGSSQTDQLGAHTFRCRATMAQSCWGYRGTK